MRVGTALLVFVVLSAPAWADDSLVSIGDQKYLTGDYSGKIKYLKYPTLGCPAIIKAGATGVAWVKIGDGGSTSTFTLTIVPTLDPAGASYALAVAGATFDATTGIYKVTYQVPSNVPADTYDLHVGVPALSVSDVQYNCFRIVLEESANFTYVAISDTHFNTPTGWWEPANYNTGGYNAYTIVQQLKKELRALNPTFVTLSGDMHFGLDYDYEYEGSWKIWKDTGVPIFMAPGNHDGIAGIEDRWFLGLHSPIRDGLDYWRKTYGPCNYSFQFGGVHFQAVNSMDGTPQRRDGFLIIIANYGGDLLPEQMDWISADLAGTSQTVVPFMHHKPIGPYKPNQTFSLSSWFIQKIWAWITTGTLPITDGQTWNTQATGEFLVQKYAGLPFVFCGHHHVDDMKVSGTTTYRLVTTSGAASGDYWGYTVVRVEGSQIVDHLYSSDEKFMSVPTGNLKVTYTDREGEEQKAKVVSGLSKSYDVTVVFLMPSAPWYVANGGTVVQFAPVSATQTKVWVKTQTPVAATIQEPQSAEIVVNTSDAPPVVAGNVETNAGDGGSGGGGGACGLVGLEALLALGLLALRRRRA